MNDFFRAFAVRKKTLAFDALAFCASAILLKATGSALLFAVSGIMLTVKLAAIWINRKKYAGKV